MRTDAIPMEPVPLTAEAAEAMLQRQVKKHHVAIILLHWSNASVWLLELVTGLALITSSYFRVGPAVVRLHRHRRLRVPREPAEFHIALGIAWVLVFLVYGVFGVRTYLSQEVLKREMALDRDDFRWLVVRTLRILGRSDEPLPPQGIYNAGQKLFAFVIYAMIPVVMLTGLVMTFRLFGPWAVGWAVVLHFAAVGVVVSGLMVHVYMGTVFPEEKPAFFSMITGNVHELFAYSHHFKWWREVKLPSGSGRRRAARPSLRMTSRPPTSRRACLRPTSRSRALVATGKVLALDTQPFEAGPDHRSQPPPVAGVGRILVGSFEDERELDFRGPALLGAQADRRVKGVDGDSALRETDSRTWSAIDCRRSYTSE